MNYRLAMLFSVLGCLMLQACGQQAQYGKEPLPLDKFNFELDLDYFFQDERIFRWNNEEGFMVSSEEIKAENDSLMPGYITYSTRSMSTEKPLATYAGVQLEDLGLITDWDDEKVLMVCGASKYKTAEDIIKIIRQLKEQYGTEPELQKGGFRSEHTLYLIYKQKDKIVQFGFQLPDVDFIAWPEKSYSSRRYDDHRMEEPQQPVLTAEIEKSIEEKLKEEANTCFLFITTPEMAAVMNGQSGRSGFLVDYKRDE